MKLLIPTYDCSNHVELLAGTLEYDGMNCTGGGSVKFNVDGAFNAVSAGCGGVLRNNNGDVSAIFYGPADHVGVDFNELLAIRTQFPSLLRQQGWVRPLDLDVGSEFLKL
ncbi:hypothetical protein V6N11_041296 [Hibiscus sabdariffa]|uniref:RNase H type-1 domain-containing protein n=1 Tax=Hibiscus sabdariffa TaxID=183260 RepID=A0ABR2RKR2_9ROSI